MGSLGFFLLGIGCWFALVTIMEGERGKPWRAAVGLVCTFLCFFFLGVVAIP